MPQPTPWNPRGGLSATCLPVAALQPQRQCHCVVVRWDAGAVQLTTASPLHHITAIDRKHPHGHLFCLRLFLWTVVQYPPPLPTHPSKHWFSTLQVGSQAKTDSNLSPCRARPGATPRRIWFWPCVEESRPCCVGLAGFSQWPPRSFKVTGTVRQPLRKRRRQHSGLTSATWRTWGRGP